MRAVVQRVAEACVTVNGRATGRIGKGLLVLLGVEEGDADTDVSLMVDKVSGLRCFPDENGKFNRSVMEVGGSIMVVSQFTLLGDCRKGKRPSFTTAARPELANALYQRVVAGLRERGLAVETGEFGAHMRVSLVNDGPVTLLIDTKRNF
ncbi:MAG TPA: D-aminoacyl-tRNA deacylase [Candidatus Hydrogenedentes bacterium]|nr:D-aminoacyl-tRNA deacylase [Candidatus Hydrogenedentota bacterium]HOL75571.1 D-aminoacyl-tRNA deacylase [Candidatus Hydrogenedentota bacterium]HPO87004.1 D-aminoacyl-tRNA deacylase [Candidatus Hydrogenedentota bacterium]